MKKLHEIISQENIRPSSPTPLDKKIYKLSMFDQRVPPIYAHIVLYYPNLEKQYSCNNNARERISQTTLSSLKQSLSSTLSRFYPLAGRIKDPLTIDCSDQGILFIVMKHSTSLSNFLKDPNPLTCRDHTPHQLTWTEPEPGSYVAKVQVNFFDCGGIAIGSVLFHKVVDGATVGTFMKAWAGLNIGSSEIYPDYQIKSLYPQIESVQRESHLLSAMKRYHKIGRTEMRRFVFDPSAISKLREQISSDGKCSRAEVVSAVMWKWFITASTAKNGGGNTKNSIVTHGVNMRRRSDPPLAESSFGNFVWTVPASVDISSSRTSSDLDLSHLTMKVRDSIREVDAGFVAKMRGDGGVSGYYDNLEESWKGFPEDGDYLAISSWCNLGLYGVDFGWGRPMWISKCGGGNDNEELPYINSLWLMDTREGDGVEAWLTLGDKYMAEMVMLSQEIKDLARVDPSPMIIG